MATAAQINSITALYVGYFDRAPDPMGLQFWIDQIDGGRPFNTIAADFAGSDEAEALYPYLTTPDVSTPSSFITSIYANLFDRVPEAAGLTFWVGVLEDGSVAIADMIEAIINGAVDSAAGPDKSILDNKIEAGLDFAISAANVPGFVFGDAAKSAAGDAVDGVTDDAATVDAAKAATDAFLAGAVNVGTDFALTSSTDTLVGTAANDTFTASLAQNSFVGGVSNTLSSADTLDGGAGADTLSASLVQEFVGVTTGSSSQIDVQPKTSNIETVSIEARELSNGGGTITLDAKNMTEVKMVESYFSDGDLVVENLTTLNNGVIDLTSTMTVAMTHTDNFNSDGDASDLSVFFDEDYLNTTTTSGNSQVQIFVVNAITNVVGENPLFGTSTFSFEIDGEEQVIDITDIGNDATLDFSTAYAAVVDLVNAQMIDAGFPTITAALGDLEPAVFSINISSDADDYSVGDPAGSYFPIIITNSGPEVLGEGDFTQADVADDTNIASTQTDVAPEDSEIPISINVDLEKVGRDGEGGNLVIGGKDFGDDSRSIPFETENAFDTDVDQNNGIEIFNIDVLGDASKPSNLGRILSTDGALRTVNIETASEFVAGGSYAALTVRGETSDGEDDTPFGGTLDTLNANDFLGDLYIGGDVDSRADDIETFTATGGGDVTYWASVGENGDLASLGNLAYSAVTAGGDDVINASVGGGAQFTVTTGAGDDTVVARVLGETDSDSTQSKIIVNSSSGDNTVVLSSTDTDINEADVTLGGGADTVAGGATHLTVDTGAGNDVIYTENTGNRTIATLEAGEFDGVSSGFNVITDAQLLDGRSVTVTVAMPESDTPANVAEGFVNGYEVDAFTFTSDEPLSTERELYEAVAEAINADEMINKLVVASVDSNGNLIVTYLVDGLSVLADEIVEIVLSDEIDDAADVSAELLAAIQAAEADSTITATQVETAYDAVATDVVATVTNAGGESTTDGNNTVTAGLGDDVIVLSSNDSQIDTVVYDEFGSGTDLIVHFEQSVETPVTGTTTTTTTTTTVNVNVNTGVVVGVDLDQGDILDFTAFLDNTESASGSSTSQVTEATVVVTATDNGGTNIGDQGTNLNSVVVYSGLDSTADATETWELITENDILTALNGGGSYATLGSAVDATFGDASVNVDGDALTAVFMIENDQNEGEYKVYQLSQDAGATDDDWDAVTLIGTLDFGETQAFLDSNFA